MSPLIEVALEMNAVAKGEMAAVNLPSKIRAR